MGLLAPGAVVVRRFSPAKLVTGLAAVAVSVGILVVVLGPSHGHVSIDGFLAMAASGVAGAVGLRVALRPTADFCVRCARRLEPTGLRLAPEGLAEATGALLHGDIETAARVAGQAAPQGTWVTVWFCPECRKTLVWLGSGKRIVVADGAALVAALPGKR